MRAPNPDVCMPSAARGKARVRSARDDALVLHWYAWDAHMACWSGPNVIQAARTGDKYLANELRTSPGPSWYGPLICTAPGEPTHRMFTLIHDVGDCAIAMLYCDESKTGPLEIVIVVPVHRRPLLRADFGFEVLAFAAFLRAIPPGAELAIHEGITAAINDADAAASVVFSISTGLWPSDCDLVLSRCTENVAMATMDWLGAERRPNA